MSSILTILATRSVAQTYSLSYIAETPFANIAEATAINDSGQVAGEHWVPRGPGWGWQGFSFANGVSTDIGGLGGSQTDVSDMDTSGRIVGNAYLPGDTSTHAYLWDGSLHDLTPGLSDWSEARAINDAGTVLGEVRAGAVTWHNGVQTALTGFTGRPMDLNSSEQVVGIDGTTAFIWANGVTTTIANNAVSYEPLRINNAGVVAGTFLTSAGKEHAFRWKDGVFTDLGLLAGRDQSRAFNVSESGVIIGGSWTVGGAEEHAFSWGGSIQDLNDHLVPGTPPTELFNARGINSQGQIVGAGSGGAFILTPAAVPEPGTLALFVSTTLVSMVRRRRRHA